MTDKRLRMYGALWSDYEGRFIEKPIPITEDDKKFWRMPEAILYAENIDMARRMIAEINSRFKGKDRYDIPSVFHQEEVLPNQ
jgi:hypothetical protein